MQRKREGKITAELYFYHKQNTGNTFSEWLTNKKGLFEDISQFSYFFAFLSQRNAISMSKKTQLFDTLIIREKQEMDFIPFMTQAA